MCGQFICSGSFQSSMIRSTLAHPMTSYLPLHTNFFLLLLDNYFIYLFSYVISFSFDEFSLCIKATFIEYQLFHRINGIIQMLSTDNLLYNSPLQ